MTYRKLAASTAIILFLCLFSLVGPVRAQSIAFTFDDGPIMGPQAGMVGADRNVRLLDQLKRAHVKAALFLTLEDGNPARMALVREWGLAGHSIGNHTVTHPDINREGFTLSDYEHEVMVCDSAIRSLPGYVKRFRFTYLSEGNTLDKRDGFRLFLKSIGYKPAPVSVDASDWYYNMRLIARLEKEPTADLAPYREAYLAHLWSRTAYYDSLSQVVLGRSVKHVLLLHHSQINALFLKDVIAMFRAKGWQIIDPLVAFEDPVYAMQPDDLPADGSILLQLAKAKGLKNLREPGESGAYEKPILDKLGL